MKTKLLIIAGILLPFILAAQAPKPFTINIKTTADAGVKIYLAYQTDGKRIIDSATKKNDIYTFTGTVSQPLRATLVADN